MLRLLKERGGSVEEFRPYLESIKKSSVGPHGGYGLGLNRLFQWILQTEDIRETVLNKSEVVG